LAYYIMTPFSGQSAAIQNRKCFYKKKGIIDVYSRTYFITYFLFCFLQNHLNRFEMMKTFLMIWCRLFSPNNNHLPFKKNIFVNRIFGDENANLFRWLTKPCVFVIHLYLHLILLLFELLLLLHHFYLFHLSFWMIEFLKI
jgi:hypothetical protein